MSVWAGGPVAIKHSYKQRCCDQGAQPEVLPHTSNESVPAAALASCVHLLVIFAQDSEEEEVETFVVSLAKNSQGLGITIAGYVGDKNSGEE